jgi:hypothetical protein
MQSSGSRQAVIRQSSGTIAHRFFQNMVYKKVCEIQIQAFMPNFSSPA